MSQFICICHIRLNKKIEFKEAFAISFLLTFSCTRHERFNILSFFHYSDTCVLLAYSIKNMVIFSLTSFPLHNLLEKKKLTKKFPYFKMKKIKQIPRIGQFHGLVATQFQNSGTLLSTSFIPIKWNFHVFISFSSYFRIANLVFLCLTLRLVISLAIFWVYSHSKTNLPYN